jgi:cation diffusion facilitator family transporter
MPWARRATGWLRITAGRPARPGIPCDSRGVSAPSSDDVSRGHRVAVAGIAASGLLAALNLVVGLRTNSTAVFATGVEFAGDVLASTVVLLGLIAAARPADADHPYGHGRLETLAAFVVGLLLSTGGAGICWQALQRVGEVHAPPAAPAVGALLVAIAVRAVMAAVKFRTGRRLRSAALAADAWNDTVDILGAVAALAAVSLARHDPARFLAADHYGGAVVGVVVVVTGVRVLRDASLELMDTMPDDASMAAVRSAALAVPGVSGVDKAHARKTGLRYHVDLHVEVDPALTVADAHAIGGHVRRRVRGDLDWVADVLVHVEPAPSVPAGPVER